MTLKKQHPYFDYSQRIVIGAVLTCLVASLWRQSNYQMWPEIVTIISGLVIGGYGVLLAINWRGIAAHYSLPRSPLSPKQKRHQRHLVAVRLGGVLLVVSALIAIANSIFALVSLLHRPA